MDESLVVTIIVVNLVAKLDLGRRYHRLRLLNLQQDAIEGFAHHLLAHRLPAHVGQLLVLLSLLPLLVHDKPFEPTSENVVLALNLHELIRSLRKFVAADELAELIALSRHFEELVEVVRLEKLLQDLHRGVVLLVYVDVIAQLFVHVLVIALGEFSPVGLGDVVVVGVVPPALASTSLIQHHLHHLLNWILIY